MNMQEFLKNKLETNQTVLTEFESKELLKQISIPIPNHRLTSSKEETISAAKDIGFPLVLKLIAEDIIHKSDTGAVILNIKTETEVVKAFDDLSRFLLKRKN